MSDLTKEVFKGILDEVSEKGYKESRRGKFREAREKITVYAGFFHDDYEYVTFSDNREDVEDFEYTSEITAPKGTWIMFKWCDEDCYFEKTPNPADIVEQWTEEFREQKNNGDDYYYEEDYSGGTELDVSEYSPEEAAHALYYLIKDQEPDGDSNYGVEWRKIEDFLV